MRSFVLPLVVFVAGVSACSLLLDTESLQKGGAAVTSDGGSSGGSGGAAGAGGAGGSAQGDAGPAPDGSAACVSDFDCQGQNFDGCKMVHCVNGTCGAGEKYIGIGVSPDADPTLVFQADEIGYPTLLADNGNFYLATWKRDGTVTNIDLRRFNEDPRIGGANIDLAALLPNAYEQYGSSPGMIVVGLLGGRLRLLFAGDPTGAPPMGMHLLDVDEVPFRVLPPAQQPAVDPGVTGYDTKPRGPVPRLLSADWGLWVQSDKLFFFDGKVAATPAYATKRVTGFAPMFGVGGPYAILETSPIGSQGGLNDATEMWANGGGASLFALVGDQGGLRRGVTSTFYPEALENVIVWSIMGAKGPSLKTNLSACLGAFCQAFGGDMIDNSGDVPAGFPEITSAKVPGKDRDRDFAESFQVTFARPDDPTKATTILIGSMIRIETNVDAGADAGTSKATPLNPANFLITAAEGPVSAPPGEIIGPTSIAMTNNGHVMAAWVERGPAMSHVLRIRRFLVKNCN